MFKISKIKFVFLFFLIIFVFSLKKFNQSSKSFVSISRNQVEFVDFPETRKGEMGLLSGFNIDSQKTKELIDRGAVEISDNLYQLSKILILSQDLMAYEIEIKNKNNDEKSFMSENDYPFIGGIVIFNKRSNKAIQFYYPSVWLDVLGGDLSPVYLKDINSDNKKEFIIKTFQGGNSVAANQYYIFQIDNNGNFTFLNPDISSNPRLFIDNFLDVNFDGNEELIIVDNTWEITSCTDHASGPLSYIIYSWKDGFGYIEDSINYQKYYQNIIDKDISKNCSGLKEFCFGPALSKYFAYKISGRESEGWKKFLELTDGVKDVTWPSKKCRDYIIQLHDSNKEITPPPVRL